MKTVKQKIFRVFFAIEIMVFTFVYIFGPQGMQVVYHINQEYDQLDKEMQKVSKEIMHIKKTIVAWKKYPFYKEKIAREQLQMARKGDRVYYLT